MKDPFVTVIVPIRNEARHIRQCLAAILAQDYPAGRMEILVVDGLSDDGTRAIVAGLAARTHRLQILDNPKQIVPAALNTGLKAARGEVIVRVDGHTIVAPDYVRACVEALQSSGADCVGGPMAARGQTPFGRAVALATSHPFGVGDSRFHYATEMRETDTVYLGAYRRQVFDRVGCFDEEMVRNQDDEFNYRLRAGGGRIVLDPAIRSIYFNRSTARSLWRQYYQYGLWKVRVAQKLPGQMRPRHFVPFGLVASLAGGALLAPFLKPVRRLWLGLLGLYALLNLGVSLAIAARRGWRQAGLLPLAFSILHLAYGSGFAAGLIRFARYWK
ncbi:MAG: glycosyltransferase family 2 protein [Anaerolineae bacterium]